MNENWIFVSIQNTAVFLIHFVFLSLILWYFFQWKNLITLIDFEQTDFVALFFGSILSLIFFNIHFSGNICCIWEWENANTIHPNVRKKFFCSKEIFSTSLQTLHNNRFDELFNHKQCIFVYRLSLSSSSLSYCSDWIKYRLVVCTFVSRCNTIIFWG